LFGLVCAVHPVCPPNASCQGRGDNREFAGNADDREQFYEGCIYGAQEIFAAVCLDSATL